MLTRISALNCRKMQNASISGDTMEKNSIVISYLLRCCMEANGCFRVYARQVQSGEQQYFTTLEEAAEYIKRQLRQARAEHEADET